MKFDEVGMEEVRRYVERYRENRTLVMKVVGLAELGPSRSLHKKLKAFLDIFKGRNGDKVIKAAQDFLERYALENMKVKVSERFRLDDDGYVNRYGQTERTYSSQIHEVAGMARMGSSFGGLEASHQVVLRTLAEKLGRLMKASTVPPIDFKTAPILDVIDYLETALLYSDNVDIETNLAMESPEAAYLLSVARLFGASVGAVAGFYHDLTGNSDSLTGDDVENTISAMQAYVAAHRPITLGAVRGIVDSHVILRETVVDVKMLPEEMSTVVEFYRHDPTRFRREVFEKGKSGNFIHPKTVARVRLAQKYGLLPSKL